MPSRDKLEEVELSDIQSIWGNQQVGFAVRNAIGKHIGAADDLALWNTRTFHLVSSSGGDFRSLASANG